MKKIGIMIFTVIFCQVLQSQESGITELDQIAMGIESYKSKTVTMRLKLKLYDRVFEKIIFYDKKNHDIEFEISSRVMKKKFKYPLLNLHEGLDYNVTFTVRDKTPLGLLVADIEQFEPVLFQLLPDR